MNRNPAITPPPADRMRPVEAGRFVPGDVLAGRFRMVASLGKGSVGEVWQADDLVLNTPVALKVIVSTDPEDRRRILDEARLVRQITHPAVCRVFDVGETEREVFYSRELVQGEDLATLLRRTGRLPSEKVVDIGQQLCDGLAAAHAQGILHRDLKPANVLIDNEGFVRIADFDVASARDGTQQDSIATDILALGLVLYELLVGRQGLEARADARRPKPSTLVADVDAHLERAIMKAIAPDPRDRPVSVLELGRLLEPSRGEKPRVWMWTAGIVTAVAAVVALASALFVSPGGRALTDQDTIVLADFQNSTGEPVFDGALKVALAVALEQSPFLKVFPDERLRETLRLMRRSPDEPVTRAIAREVARREQLKALVSGSIASLGSHYVVALEAINAETGEVLAREQVEVPAKEQVLASLGAATSRLRERLGESLAVIERFDVPLAQATTASLDALHAYSLALDQGRMVPRPEAIPHLRRAIELDPNFAMAHALLSGVYANSGRSSDAPAFARKAFELRDRVSQRERFFIAWRHHLDAEQAWDKALDVATSWTRTYPREAFAFNSLGRASAAFGQHEQAIDAFREAVRLDERFAPAYGNLAGSLIALNRLDEAGELVSGAGARGIDMAGVRRLAFLLAFLNNDPTAMTRELEAMRRTPQAAWALSWEARTSAFSGRMQRAHDLYARAAETAVGEGSRELAAQWTMEDAESHAVAAECDRARREVAAGLALSRDNFTVERAARTLALCSDAADASRLGAELGTRFPAATLTVRMHLPVIAAITALRRREFARVVELLEPVKPYDHVPAAEFWPAYLRGEAYLGLKDGAAAAAEFESIVNRRGAAPASPLYAPAYAGAARAAALRGDRDGARAPCQAFLALWNQADPPARALGESPCGEGRLQ